MYDHIQSSLVKGRMKVSAFCPGDTVVGPKNLLNTGCIYRVIYRPARVGRRKGYVALWMPVLCRRRKGKHKGKRINGLDDFVTAFNGK
jgi:hypothetical protein